MNALLRRPFDVEGRKGNWDLRLWPFYARLEFQRKLTSSGVLTTIGAYRFGRWSFSVEWHVAG